MKPFADLKVVELATVLAGPLCGSFFAELGAEVIKIENPGQGDMTRSWKLTNELPDSKVSAYFASANYGKIYQRYDLNEMSQRLKVYELIKNADILLTNYKKGDAEKFGLNDGELYKLNPTLIHGSISGFGENDARTAFDMVLQAESGFLSMCGTDNSNLAKMPVALIDVLAAHQLKEGILIALMQKLKTGKGSKVTVSLFDTAVSSLVNQASNWLMAGHMPKPYGTLHPNIAPYGEIITDTNGERIVLAVGNNVQFYSLCDILQLPELKNDNRFSSNFSRVQNRIELGQILNKASKSMQVNELMKDLILKKVPAGQIKSIAEVFQNPAANALLLNEIIDGINTIRPKSVVFKMTDLIHNAKTGK